MDTLPCIIQDTILANQHKVPSGQELVRPVRAGAVCVACTAKKIWPQVGMAVAMAVAMMVAIHVL